MKKIFLPLLILCISLFAAGCIHTDSPGNPKSYDDQILENGKPRVEQNFLDACLKSTNNEIQDITNYCDCVYGEIKNNIAFEDFETFNNELKNNPTLLSAQQAVPGSTHEKILKYTNEKKKLDGSGGCL